MLEGFSDERAQKIYISLRCIAVLNRSEDVAQLRCSVHRVVRR